VIGVLDLANDIKIKVPGGLTRTDTEMAQAVRHTLQWDVFVPDEKITSTVSDGWVTLDGTGRCARDWIHIERRFAG
jgi:osmotically-inducible protein OsmY